MRVLGLLALSFGLAAPFAPRAIRHSPRSSPNLSRSRTSVSPLLMSDDDGLEKKFGGYTVKQRLREEVESPFRTVRLYFFGFSTISAFVALYFSLLSTIKAYTGGWSDAPPLDEALQSCAINIGAVALCGFITFRDWKAGEANLARIAKGGALASLVVSPADTTVKAATLKDYRRNSRVLIAAGGKEYISSLCRSLNADQLVDENNIPSAIAAADMIVVPVLLEADGTTVGDTASAWATTVSEDTDRNFDVDRSSKVIAFPRGNNQWADCLKSEVETATGQGFDVISKGFNIILKKNGRVLRRATGQPRWSDLLGTMEVLDGSKFGMPGDDEKYGS